jgi:hypothetical protein
MCMLLAASKDEAADKEAQTKKQMLEQACTDAAKGQTK